MRMWLRAVLAALSIALTATAQSDDLAAKASRADAAMAASRFEEAAAIYRDLWRALPAEIGLRKNLGLALYSAGAYSEAISHFEAFLKQHPSDAPVSFLLGMSEVKRGNPGAALVSLRKAVAAES